MNEECKLYIDSIFELIFNLKNINKITTKSFLDIILSILKINIIIPYLIKILNNTEYNKLINIEIIKVKFTYLIEELSNNNLLIFNLKKLLIIKVTDEIKEIIETITKILACEYFMDYKSFDILKLMNNKLKIIQNNSILVNILKYKKKIIYEYNELSSKYNDLYIDINIMINKDYKYKIQNNFFLEMNNDIENIENAIKTN